MARHKGKGSGLWWTFVAVAASAILTYLIVNLLPDRRDVKQPLPPAPPVASAEFQRTLSGSFHGRLEPGHLVETLVNGDQILPAMLEAIDNAQVSVNFESYVYWPGETAQAFEAALIAAARRGVEVRLLIDWIGSYLVERAPIDAMRRAGVRVELFRPPRLADVGRLNNRTHRKILVVDGQIGFTGGVGVADEWAGDAGSPQEWRENHYRIRGPAVADMQGAFAEHWLEATGEMLVGERFYPQIAPAGDMLAQFVPQAFGGSNMTLHVVLLFSIAAAENNIRIAMPYFVPDNVVIDQLVAAALRGVEVDIVLPGDEIGMNFIRRASRHFWGDLLRAGVRIYEYQPTLYHKKMISIDDTLVNIGSANINSRSFRHDHEANLLVIDPGFAAEQNALFAEDIDRSRRITLDEWENRPLTMKIGDFLWSFGRAHF